jgi:hypothetical protein
MKKWEYWVCDDTKYLSEEKLNELGASGWELVNVATNTYTDRDGYVCSSYVYALKREVNIAP